MEQTYERALEIMEEALNTGNEEAAKKVIVDHLNEFPEEIRDRLVFACFMDAVEKESTIISALNAIKEEGLEQFKESHKEDKKIELEEKIDSIKDDIKNLF